MAVKTRIIVFSRSHQSATEALSCAVSILVADQNPLLCQGEKREAGLDLRTQALLEA